MTIEKVWSNIKWALTALVIPSISILIWGVVIGTRALGQLTAQGADIKEIKQDLRGLHTQVDTISIRQHDQSIISSYQFKLQQATGK